MFHSLFFQLTSLDEHNAFPSMHSLASKVSKVTSIMAEMFTSPDEVTSTNEAPETPIIITGKAWVVDCMRIFNSDHILPIKLYGPMHFKIGVTCVYNGHVFYTLLL